MGLSLIISLRKKQHGFDIDLFIKLMKYVIKSQIHNILVAQFIFLAMNLFNYNISSSVFFFQFVCQDYYNMNKCQHGEKITIFCATDCCLWKQAAGCSHCMKKYHNHMGTTVFLQEQDINSLVKKYTLEGSIKPKCRMLQEAVYSYFNLLKTEFTNAIDIASKNIINQIGYPYLYSNNNLSAYKRLKNKEYRKLVQKQFKNLYQTSQQINEKQLMREQSKIYLEEVKKVEDIVHSLEDTAKHFESAIKKISSNFTHDSSYIYKISEIIKNLNIESPAKPSKTKEKEMSPVKLQVKFKSSPEKESPKGKNSAESKENNDQKPKIQYILASPPQLLKPNYARNASIDKKLVKENKFLSYTPSNNIKQKEKEKDKDKQPTLKQMKHLNNDKLEQVKQQLNNKEIQINEKKRMLIEMMKQKQQSIKNAKQMSNNSIIQKKQQPKSILNVGIPSYFKRQLSQSKAHKETVQTQKSHEVESNIKTQSEENSNYQLDLFQNGLKNNESQVQIKAFTQLPLQLRQIQKQEDKQEVKQKIIIVSKPKELESIKGKGIINNSPILKKKNSIAIKHQELQQNNIQLTQIQSFEKVNSEALELKESQQKSLALLLKSLTLNAQDAIKYLQSALNQAQNNLSAAQYLSYLYLEQNKPHYCLHLCNKILQKLQNSAESEQLALIINNNKAAALNILGRYSQSILILQRCLKFKEKDCLYKNLGDAYFSISIYEKAIYNYEKALVMNEIYDEAQYNLAVCLYIQQNYHNARLAIQKAISIHPDNDQYLKLQTNIEMRITDY